MRNCMRLGERLTREYALVCSTPEEYLKALEEKAEGLVFVYGRG